MATKHLSAVVTAQLLLRSLPPLPLLLLQDDEQRLRMWRRAMFQRILVSNRIYGPMGWIRIRQHQRAHARVSSLRSAERPTDRYMRSFQEIAVGVIIVGLVPPHYAAHSRHTSSTAAQQAKKQKTGLRTAQETV